MKRAILRGRESETGKVRHHELARYWLRYYPAVGELVLEAIGDAGPYSLLPPRTVAVSKGKVFEVATNERMARMVVRPNR